MQVTVLIQNAKVILGNKIIFTDLNLTLPAGQWTCLLGASGIGKSTLLHGLADLLPLQGQIKCDNGVPLARQISYMGQRDALLPWLTVLNNAVIGFRLRNTLTKKVIQQAKNLLTEVNLSEFLNYYPQQLSGGMRQRVALVRTLLEDKPIVLMDEPFSALDTLNRLNLQNLAVELLKNKTVLFVTHDPLEAVRLANHIYILQGNPSTLYSPFSLNNFIPRDPSAKETIELQRQLFAELMLC